MCIGIVPSALLAWLAWIAAYPQLSMEAQAKFNWVGPLMFVLMVASAVVAGLAFAMNRSVQKELRRDARLVLEDMDDIYAPHRGSAS